MAHQENNNRKETLPPNVQMNSDMDAACKSERTSNRVISSNTNKFITPYPGSGAMLILNGKWVTTKYATQIQDAIMAMDHIVFPPGEVQGKI